MTIKITGRASSNDDNANVSVARESVQRVGERVAHLLVEIDAPCAAQRNDRNSVRYSCRQNIGVHPVLLSQVDALKIPTGRAYWVRMASSALIDGLRGSRSPLLCAKLSQSTEPVFEVVGPGDPAVLDRLDIYRHDPKALAGMRHTEEIAGRRSRDLAADDDTIAGDKDFLDVELHIWDRLGEAADDSDGVVSAPALPRKIPPARLVVRRKDLFLQSLHIVLDRLVKQRVPRRDDGAGLCLCQRLSRTSGRDRQDGDGNDQFSELFHRVS